MYIRELLRISILLVRSIVIITTTLVTVSIVPSRSVYSALNIVLFFIFSRVRFCLICSIVLALIYLDSLYLRDIVLYIYTLYTVLAISLDIVVLSLRTLLSIVVYRLSLYIANDCIYNLVRICSSI